MSSTTNRYMILTIFTLDSHKTDEDTVQEVIFMQIGTSDIVYRFLEDLLIQLKEVATVGDHLNIEVCMDIMDLLYEKEETSPLYSSPHSLVASILVASYVITVPKHRLEFPLLLWGKFPLLYPSYLII
ncbi:cyclin-J18 isoform X2 [Tanacetum coccineum]